MFSLFFCHTHAHTHTHEFHLSQIVYLGAFSCEVSWLLEAHGELPIAAYTRCTLYFVMFVATTILIHGLVSGLCWPLFAWSVVIGLLSIPELVLVMLMTTQHWVSIKERESCKLNL